MRTSLLWTLRGPGGASLEVIAQEFQGFRVSVGESTLSQGVWVEIGP